MMQRFNESRVLGSQDSEQSSELGMLAEELVRSGPLSDLKTFLGSVLQMVPSVSTVYYDCYNRIEKGMSSGDTELRKLAQNSVALGVRNPPAAISLTEMFHGVVTRSPLASSLGQSSRMLSGLLASVTSVVADHETMGLKWFREADYLRKAERIASYIAERGYANMRWTGNAVSGIDKDKAAEIFRGWGFIGLTGYNRFVNDWLPPISSIYQVELPALYSLVGLESKRLKQIILNSARLGNLDASNLALLEEAIKVSSKSLILNVLVVIKAVYLPIADAIVRGSAWMSDLLGLITKRIDLTRSLGKPITWVDVPDFKTTLNNTIFKVVLPYPSKVNSSGTITRGELSDRVASLSSLARQYSLIKK